MNGYTIGWGPDAKRIALAADDDTFEAITAGADRLARSLVRLSMAAAEHRCA